MSLPRGIRLTRILAVVVALALAAAGCGGGDDEGEVPPAGQNFTADHLDRFLVKGSDLPSGYEQQERESGSGEEFVDSAQTREEADFLRRLAAPGLQAFEAITYRKEEGKDNNMPASLALLYDSSRGASKALPLLRRTMASTFRVTGDPGRTSRERIPISRLGDESLPGLRFRLGPYSLFLYTWRNRNVTVGLGGGDTLGDMSADSLLELAKRVDFRAER